MWSEIREKLTFLQPRWQVSLMFACSYSTSSSVCNVHTAVICLELMAKKGSRVEKTVLKSEVLLLHTFTSLFEALTTFNMNLWHCNIISKEKHNRSPLRFPPGQASKLTSQCWLMKQLVKSGLTCWRKSQAPSEPVSGGDILSFSFIQTYNTRVHTGWEK